MWESCRVPGSRTASLWYCMCFELRTQSPSTWLLGEPCCLPACLGWNGRPRTNKKRVEALPTSSHKTGPLQSTRLHYVKPACNWWLLQIWSHALLQCIWFTVREGLWVVLSLCRMFFLKGQFTTKSKIHGFPLACGAIYVSRFFRSCWCFRDQQWTCRPSLEYIGTR